MQLQQLPTQKTLLDAIRALRAAVEQHHAAVDDGTAGGIAIGGLVMLEAWLEAATRGPSA